jgi:sigma-B regulation protein RsbU (phosphoserine phosphatase)
MHSLFHSHEPDPPPAVEPVPTVFPTIQGAQIAAKFVGTRAAGDFYDSIRVGPERVLIGLLNVAARREENRLILATAQRIFRESGAQIFSKPDLNESDALTELTLLINRALIDGSTSVRSCPAFIACYHEQFGTLCYANAGHTPALLRDHTGVIELTSTGLPLGLFSHATADAPTVGMEKGSALVVVSRGVVDCPAARDDDSFGLDRVKQLLQESTSSAQDLCTSILNAVNTFAGDAPLRDDRTTLALVRTA